MPIEFVSGIAGSFLSGSATGGIASQSDAERLSYVVAEDETVSSDDYEFRSTPGTLLNYGVIEGSITVDSVYDEGVRVTNHGLLDGGIDGYESRITLFNTGQVTGWSYLDSASLRIVNSGEVHGRIYVTESFSAAPIVIENNGVMTGGVDGSYFQRDQIVNTGLMEGPITFFGGRDEVSNPLGVIDGDVDLGWGQDIYWAADGSVSGTVYGNDGDDHLTGGSAQDRLSGGVGRDILIGNGGNDRMEGGRHFDILTGGEGRDVFVFLRGYGGETITDFENNRDVLEFDEGIWGGGLTPAQLLETYASTVDGTTYIDFGGRDVITLEGIDDYRLLANDIVFA